MEFEMMKGEWIEKVPTYENNYVCAERKMLYGMLALWIVAGVEELGTHGYKPYLTGHQYVHRTTDSHFDTIDEAKAAAENLWNTVVTEIRNEEKPYL
jgi:hypothetical protein